MSDSSTHLKLKIIPIEDLYEIKETIGKGCFGTILKAINRESGQLCALKRIRLNLDGDSPERDIVMEILNTGTGTVGIVEYRNVNLVTIETIVGNNSYPGYKSVNETFICLEMDLFDRDLIPKYFNDSIPREITIEDVKILWNMTTGVKACHDVGILHNDIKPGNYLARVTPVTGVNGTNQIIPESITLGDFGLSMANWCTGFTRNKVAALMNRAPEVFLKLDHSDKTDVWALGSTFYQILFKSMLFQPFNTEDTERNVELSMLASIFSLRGDPENEYSEIIKNYHSYRNVYEELYSSGSESPSRAEEWNLSIRKRVDSLVPLTEYKRNELFNDLLSNMTEINITKRYSIDDVRAHPFFDEVRSVGSTGTGTVYKEYKIVERKVRHLPCNYNNINLNKYYKTLGWLHYIGRNVSLPAYHYAVELFEQLITTIEPSGETNEYKLIAIACLLIGQVNYRPCDLFSNDIEVSIAQDITPRQINEIFWSIVLTYRSILNFNTLYDLLLVRVRLIVRKISKVCKRNSNEVRLILSNFIQIVMNLVVCSRTRDILPPDQFVNGVESWISRILFPQYFIKQQYPAQVIQDGNYLMETLSKFINNAHSFDSHIKQIYDEIYKLFNELDTNISVNQELPREKLYNFLSESTKTKSLKE